MADEEYFTAFDKYAEFIAWQDEFLALDLFAPSTEEEIARENYLFKMLTMTVRFFLFCRHDPGLICKDTIVGPIPRAGLPTRSTFGAPSCACC